MRKRRSTPKSSISTARHQTPNRSRRSRQPAKKTGFACQVTISNSLSGKADCLEVRLQSSTLSAKRQTPEAALARAARSLVRHARPDRCAILLNSLASTHRLKIAYRLLEGPAGYRQLQEATTLQAGPLYHHIDELRLAGLVQVRRPGGHNLYELSKVGTRLTILSLVISRFSG